MSRGHPLREASEIRSMEQLENFIADKVKNEMLSGVPPLLGLPKGRSQKAS